MDRVLQKNLVKCVLRLSLLWELRLSSAGKSCSMHFCIVPSKDQKLRILSFNSYQLLFEVYPWEHWFQPTWEHLCLNMAPRTLTRKEELWNGPFNGTLKWLRRCLPQLKSEASLRDVVQGTKKATSYILCLQISSLFLGKSLRCFVLFVINLSLPICKQSHGRP